MSYSIPKKGNNLWVEYNDKHNITRRLKVMPKLSQLSYCYECISHTIQYYDNWAKKKVKGAFA